MTFKSTVPSSCAVSISPAASVTVRLSWVVGEAKGWFHCRSKVIVAPAPIVTVWVVTAAPPPLLKLNAVSPLAPRQAL